MKKKSQELVIIEANKIHKNKYLYTKVNYTGALNKIIIICPIHGEFEQIVNNHLRGAGCPICSNDEKIKGIYSPELDMRFTSETEAAIYLGVTRQCINNYLKGKGNSAGKHPETGCKLTWKFI